MIVDTESICPSRTISISSSGMVISPHYPEKYYKDYKCTLSFLVPIQSQITFTVGSQYDTFAIGGRCTNWEYLKIVTPLSIGSYCGNRPQNSQLSSYRTGNNPVSVSIKLRSDRLTHPWINSGSIFAFYYNGKKFNKTLCI